MGVNGQRHAPAALYPKRLPVPIVQEAEWVPESVWTERLEEKILRLCRGSNLERFSQYMNSKLDKTTSLFNIDTSLISSIYKF
jgi:hypothetical protein